MSTSNDDDEGPPAFPGFAPPESNYFRMPVDWIDITAGIKNIAELKVVQYVLRHTWGYREYGVKKHITIDEFVAGRRRRDGGRMDRGTGLSERAVRYGLDDALAHGFLEEERDESDKARIKRSFSLRMRLGTSDDETAPPLATGPAIPRQDLQAEVQTLHPGVQALQGRGAKSAPRTEIDTLEQTFSSTAPHPASQGYVVDSSSSREASSQKLIGLDVHQDQRQAPAAAGPNWTSTRNAADQRHHRQASPAGQRRLGTPPQAIVTPTIAPAERDAIRVYVAEFAEALHDQSTFNNSLARVCNIYARSGLTLGGFSSRMVDCKQRAQAKRLRDPKKRFAYWCRLLADACGVRELPEYSPLAPQVPTPAQRSALNGTPAAAEHAVSVEELDEETWVRLPENANAGQLWERVLARLADHLPRPSFEVYLRGTVGTGIGEDGRLIVVVPSEFAIDWLASKLYPRIRQTLEAVEGLAVGVDFVVGTTDDTPAQIMPSEARRGPRKPRNRASGPMG